MVAPHQHIADLDKRIKAYTQALSALSRNVAPDDLARSSLQTCIEFAKREREMWLSKLAENERRQK